jgi:hypothetical protein
MQTYVVVPSLYRPRGRRSARDMSLVLKRVIRKCGVRTRRAAMTDLKMVRSLIIVRNKPTRKYRESSIQKARRLGD